MCHQVIDSVTSNSGLDLFSNDSRHLRSRSALRRRLQGTFRQSQLKRFTTVPCRKSITKNCNGLHNTVDFLHRRTVQLSHGPVGFHSWIQQIQIQLACRPCAAQRTRYFPRRAGYNEISLLADIGIQNASAFHFSLPPSKQTPSSKTTSHTITSRHKPFHATRKQQLGTFSPKTSFSDFCIIIDPRCEAFNVVMHSPGRSRTARPGSFIHIPSLYCLTRGHAHALFFDASTWGGKNATFSLHHVMDSSFSFLNSVTKCQI
jgi:hypothetical protein